VRWRRQALEWLRQDLAWCSKRLNDGNTQVLQWPRRWQGDPSFASVRAKDGLDKLPDEERRNWQQFWSDVDALLRRDSTPK